MAAICECLHEGDVFLGCYQDRKNGELDETKAALYMNDRKLKVKYPGGEFSVYIAFCPLCGRRLKEWNEA